MNPIKLKTTMNHRVTTVVLNQVIAQRIRQIWIKSYHRTR